MYLWAVRVWYRPWLQVNSSLYSLYCCLAVSCTITKLRRLDTHFHYRSSCSVHAQNQRLQGCNRVWIFCLGKIDLAAVFQIDPRMFARITRAGVRHLESRHFNCGLARRWAFLACTRVYVVELETAWKKQDRRGKEFG